MRYTITVLVYMYFAARVVTLAEDLYNSRIMQRYAKCDHAECCNADHASRCNVRTTHDRNGS